MTFRRAGMSVDCNPWGRVFDGILVTNSPGSGQARIQVSRGKEADLQDDFKGAASLDVHE